MVLCIVAIIAKPSSSSLGRVLVIYLIVKRNCVQNFKVHFQIPSSFPLETFQGKPKQCCPEGQTLKLLDKTCYGDDYAHKEFIEKPPRYSGDNVQQTDVSMYGDVGVLDAGCF